MKENNLLEVKFIISDENILLKKAISPEYFLISNILERINNREDIEDCFYLMLIERSILSFCKSFSKKQELSHYIDLLKKMLDTNCTFEKVIEYKYIFENMKKIYVNDSANSIVVKILQ
ncbi:hypothetical protein [Phocaeicola sp.]